MRQLSSGNKVVAVGLGRHFIWDPNFRINQILIGFMSALCGNTPTPPLILVCNTAKVRRHIILSPTDDHTGIIAKAHSNLIIPESPPWLPRRRALAPETTIDCVHHALDRYTSITQGRTLQLTFPIGELFLWQYKANGLVYVRAVNLPALDSPAPS